jgi:hypothetical protein
MVLLDSAGLINISSGKWHKNILSAGLIFKLLAYNMLQSINDEKRANVNYEQDDYTKLSCSNATFVDFEQDRILISWF